MMWNESVADPSVPLDDATRFRLVFGPLWSGESNSSYQIYYIKAITIVLTGAPPAENEKPPEKETPANDDKNDDKDKDKDNAKPKDDTKKDEDYHALIPGSKGDGNGGGDESGSGSGSNRNVGPGGGTGGGGSTDAVSASGGSGGDTPGRDTSADAGANARSTASGAGAIPFEQNGRYRVYEMISNSESLVAPINMDLPGLRAAGPIAGGCVAAGGLSFFIGFRKRLF
jgi:hypothetical protein